MEIELAYHDKGSSEEKALANRYAEVTYDNCAKEFEGSCVSFLAMADVDPRDERTLDVKGMVRRRCDRDARDYQCIAYARYLAFRENDGQAGLTYADRSCDANDAYACFESAKIVYKAFDPSNADQLLPRLGRFCELGALRGGEPDEFCKIYESSDGTWNSIRYQELIPARGDDPAVTIEEFFSQ